MTQKTKKHSAAKKLVPAAGMLAVSAMMLATSTYAWFTMAREVEVTNIQMTASVPADLQISLGMLQGLGTGDAVKGLSGNEGFLVPAINNNTADNGGVATPGDDALYWSNTADISAYYALGKIMPASSTDGKDIYFTPDATGVGKTLKTNAQYYTAVKGSDIAHDENGAEYMSTLHAYTAQGGDNWAGTTGEGPHYKKASEYDKTNDDGYFVDIPVWIRSSNDQDVNLSVDAYVTTNAKNDEDDLYLAARAVILNDGRSESQGLIAIKKDSYGTADAPGTSIVDFMTTTNATGAAVQSISGEGGSATYGAERYYDGTTGNGVSVEAGSNGQFGTPTKIWIRVWLEGEDPNCWNENAGQDFNISLKFSREDVKLPTLTNFTPSASASSTEKSLVAGTQTTIKYPNGDTIGYTFNGNTWVADDTFKAAPLGHMYKYTNTATNATYEIQNSEHLINAIKAEIKTKDAADAGFTMTDVIVSTPTSGKFKWNGSSFDLLPTASTDKINSYYVNVNGVEKYVAWSDSINWATAMGMTPNNGDEYDIRIVYNADAPTYTATYETLPITPKTGSTAAGGSLKLLRVDKATPDTDSVDHEYTWYVAGDNTYVIPAGAKVTAATATDMNATKIADIVTTLNAANNASAATVLGDLTVEDVEIKTGVDVAISGDPGAGTLKLTKTVKANVASWAKQAVGDAITNGTAEDNGYSIDGTKRLKWNNAPTGTTVTVFASVDDLVTALNTAHFADTPIISYQDVAGTYTVTRSGAAGSYSYAYNKADGATFPTSGDYSWALDGGTAGNYSALETALAAITAEEFGSHTVTVVYTGS